MSWPSLEKRHNLEMVRRRSLPRDLTGGAFSVTAAAASGVPRSRLRASDLVAPLRGVRAPVGAIDPIAAVAVRLPPDALFSHLTAAAIYGFPLTRRMTDVADVHVSVPATSSAPRIRGVVAHRLSGRREIRTVGPYRVPPPAVVWTQLASLLSRGTVTESDLVVFGDYLLRRKRPLCTLHELAAAAESMGSARGARSVRRALGHVRADTDSPMETRLRLLLVEAGLPEPVVGHTIVDDDGYFVGTPDLAYVDAKMRSSTRASTTRKMLPSMPTTSSAASGWKRRAGW